MDRALDYQYGRVHRFGFILIKRDFLDALIKDKYTKYFNQVKENLNSLIFDNLERYESESDREYNYRNSFINTNSLSKALFFFNDEYDILLNFLLPTVRLLRDYRKDVKKDNNLLELIDNSAYLSSIYMIYRSINKTFYPNLNSRITDYSIISFSQFLVNYNNS